MIIHSRSIYLILFFVISNSIANATDILKVKAETYRNIEFNYPENTLKKDSISVRWKFKTQGMIISTPIISDGKVIVGSNDKKLYALDEISGKELWSFKCEGEIASSPAVLNDLVCFGSLDGYYYAVELNTGREKWKFKTGGEKKIGAKGLWGMLPSDKYMEDQYDFFLSSPIFTNTASDTIAIFGSSDGYLYAINVNTGSLKWKFKTNGPIRSTPTLYDNMLFFGSWDTYVYCIDPFKGKEIWRYKTGSDDQFHVLEGIQASPKAAFGRIYIGARDGFLHALDYKTGVLDWKFDAENSWIVSSVAICDNMVYLSTSDSYLIVALNAVTGKEKFRTKTNGYNLSSPTISKESLIVGDFSGMLHILDIKSGEVQSNFETDGRKQNKKKVLDNDGNLNFEFSAKGRDMQLYETNEHVLNEFFQLGSIISSPTTSENTIYFGTTEGILYALSF